MFQVISNGRPINEIKEPYAIVLKPSFTLVRMGEKEIMEAEYEGIIERFSNYEETESSRRLMDSINQLLTSYGLKVPDVTPEMIRESVKDYLLVPIPPTQEDVRNTLEISGYLKRYYGYLLNDNEEEQS